VEDANVAALPRVVMAALVVVGLAWAGMAWTLGVGGLSSPGPGAWPLVVGGAVAALAALTLVRIVRGGRSADPLSAAIPAAAATFRTGAASASLIVFGVAWTTIGYPAAIALLLLFWLRGLGREPWPISIGLAVGGTLVLHAIFAVALGVTFPGPAWIAPAVLPPGTSH
jgi:putative tricarboxylic transport membrane protein